MSPDDTRPDDDEADSLAGSEIGGCRILRELGEGAMGTVYLAEQLSLKRKVALKVLSAELSERADVVERFHREAQSAAQLAHGNIVQVYDVGEDQGYHYIRIEFVDGETVQDMLDREGRIPASRAVEIVRQAAVGLARAEESGLVHRDIKPENLMVSTRGEVKIADFGLAKSVEAPEEAGITHEGTVVGTPYYMSPEQASDQPVDTRSDIYSLGATLYHMVTGEPPFIASTYMGVLKKHLSEPLEPARRRYAACPESVSRLIERMMAKTLHERFQSARDLLAAIAEVKKVLRSGIRRAVGSTAKEATNRRRYRRIAAEFVADVAEKTAPVGVAASIAAKISDISEGGIFIETDHLSPPGTLVEISFRLTQDAPPLRVVGVVRWLKETGANVGMGLQFVRMPREVQEPITRFLTQRESSGALHRLTRTDLHKRVLRLYHDQIGNSMSAHDIAGKVGSSVKLVKPVIRELEQHGLGSVGGGEVTFLPAEDDHLSSAIRTWVLQEQARE